MVRDTANFNTTKYAGEQPHGGSGIVRIQKALEMISGTKVVLDLGCWDGSIAKMIKDQGNVVHGMENSRQAVELARTKGIIVHEGNIEDDWPDFGIEFDAVFAGEIIEHVFDTDLFLERVRKILKPGGELVLTTPNIAALGRRLMLLFGISPIVETTAREHDAGHIRYFTKATLFSLLRDNNFEVVRFASDVINFTSSGNFYSEIIPRYLPTLGRSLIVKAVKHGNTDKR